MGQLKQEKNRPKQAVLYILVFALIALAMLAIINASGGSIVLEPETGQLSDPAKIGQDPTASNASFITFNGSTKPSPTPTPTPAPNPTPTPPPTGNVPTMTGQTSSGLKLQNETSLETGSFQSTANGKILVWIMAVMAPDTRTSPQNIDISGHGTRFELITTFVKPNNTTGSRKLYLYSGTPSSNSSGKLTLNLGQNYSASRLSWSVVTTNAQTITIDQQDTEGNITGQHTANFSSTNQNALYVAGYGIGTGKSINDDPQSDGSISGASTRGVAYSQWSTSPVNSMTASWGDNAHAFSVSLLLK